SGRCNPQLEFLDRFDWPLHWFAHITLSLPCGSEKENFDSKNPYQNQMNEQDLPLPGARRCNRKIKAITSSMIVGMTVYGWDINCSKQAGTNIVKISEANYNPDLCRKIIVEALVSLPAGFYTVVYHTDPLPYVMVKIATLIRVIYAIEPGGGGPQALRFLLVIESNNLLLLPTFLKILCRGPFPGILKERYQDSAP